MDDTAPGWDAIDEALARIYPGVEPLHFGTLIKFMLGGPDPLDGVSFYRRDDHWHLIGYGMSELYARDEDEDEGDDESGWGFEFTFRIARPAGEEEPPMWAANLLQNLARYVFSSGNPFGPGHHLDLNGPICLSTPDTAIRAAAFVDDPELGVIDTPHGQVRFLQLVGLTAGEYDAIQQWNTEGVLGALAPHLPLFVTDPARGDLMADPGVAAAVEQGARRDGSSTGALYVAEAGWQVDGDVTAVTFGANAAPRLGRVLAARLPFGHGLVVQAPTGAVAFSPGDRFATADLGEGLLEVHLPASALDEVLAVMHPVARTHRPAGTPGLEIRIVKSQIRDQAGAVVAEVG